MLNLNKLKPGTLLMYRHREEEGAFYVLWWFSFSGAEKTLFSGQVAMYVGLEKGGEHKILIDEDVRIVTAKTLEDFFEICQT